MELMHFRGLSRRWVVQELLLAWAATLNYGDKIIHWQDFSDAVATFVTRFDEIRKIDSIFRTIESQCRL